MSTRLFVLVLTGAITAPALAQFCTFSGPLNSTRPVFEQRAGGVVARETFDTLPNGGQVSNMPSVPAFFAPEYADGAPAPLPIASTGSPVTPGIWMINFQNGRPAWSSWVVRPQAGQSIYAFGQANSQGDHVRIQAFDAAGAWVGSVDAPALSHAFAGFVSQTPIARVVVTPLGNADGRNGMDDVQISTTIPPRCIADIDDGSGTGAPDCGVGIEDLLYYLSVYDAGDLGADVDDGTGTGTRDGGVGIEDLLYYLTRYDAGC
jgi:hypothetical protein